MAAKKTVAKKKAQVQIREAPGPSPALVPRKKIATGVREFPLNDPNKIPDKIWDLFIEELSERGHVTDSCKAAGIKRITVYFKRDRDPAFAQRMRAAHQQGLEHLEDLAVKRVKEGVVNPVYQGGVQVGETTLYSDHLLTFLLTGNNQKYRRRQEITGAEGGPLMVLINTMDDTELDVFNAAKLRELEDARKAAAEE